MSKLKQFFCAHRIRAFQVDVKVDPENGVVILTETCFKCGKKFVHTLPYDILSVNGDIIWQRK